MQTVIFRQPALVTQVKKSERIELRITKKPERHEQSFS